MNIYDLTKTLSDKTEVYPGDPPFSLSHIAQMPQSPYNLARAEFCLHTGTHADAPLHFIQNGTAIDALPPEHFIGQAFVIRVKPENGVIKADEILSTLGNLRDERIIILHTGCECFLEIPIFDREIGEELYRRDIITLASDLPSFEPAAAMHRNLLGRSIVLIEGLTALDTLPSDRIFLYAAPLKIKGGDGAPLRAFAVI